MPLVSIEYPAGQLTGSQKADLAGEVTGVMLEIEGGGDTPHGREGTLVRFRESDREDWYIGGANDDTYVRGRDVFVVDVRVPEGLLDQSRVTQAHHAISSALARVTGAGPDKRRYFWIQVQDWPNGSFASNGDTIDLFGIAKRAGHPADHPVLTFPRAYFEAKHRMFDAHGFPDSASGRSKNIY
jgi:phenylpyruvate tautomerase PptA (4-oxalocrotonate tautomerase family)